MVCKLCILQIIGNLIIENRLKRGEEYDTYLIHVCMPWSIEASEQKTECRRFQPT